MTEQRNKGGRPHGSDDSIVAARKTVKNFTKLEKKVNAALFRAFDILLAVMDDEKAPAATRKAAAVEILSMYQKFYGDATGRLEEYEENKANRLNDTDDDQEVEDAKTGTTDSVMTFKPFK